MAISICSVVAQSNRVAKAMALEFLQLHYYDLGLTQADVADTRISDAFVSKHNGVTHVWLQQQHLGIPVFNALIGLHVAKDGQVYTVGHRFTKDLQRNANTTLPSLSAAKALEIAMTNIGFGGFSIPSLRKKINDRNLVFEGGAISRGDIPVSACFAQQIDGTARLAWTMVIDQANTADIWNIRVDALTGQILSKINQTQYCNAGHVGHEEGPCGLVPDQETVPAALASGVNLLADETYHVFALPLETPNHGSRSIVTNPHDPNASPYGWLDTDGAAGAEFTYTRGNNVWAFDDSAGDNMADPSESPNAGPTLNFDFPYDGNLEPVANRLAAVTNLFYMNNMMHDITYRFGFDEAAGNFQQNNYGNGGEGGDAVLAEGLDGSGTNNADFATPSDGGPGRMQMFLWNTAGGGIVKVNEPAAVAGTYFGGQGGWGGAITSTALTADVVFVNDGIDPTVGCTPPLNNVTGKIVMVDRGECAFGEKALLVEQAGAVACIICDHEAPPKAGFGPGEFGDQVNIPALYMKKADCSLIRQYAGTELKISLVQPPTGGGPLQLDGGFDNGIIAHEYGHGISMRLTGGPNSNGCLENAEQMGEGWSDFFALATTVRTGDSGTTKRGIGTYVSRQPIDGNGTRRYPYSTDMSVNPLSFSAVAENPEVHALGEVWAAMTWDLYWAMVEKYGYDADINNTNSGNARAIQLVMDGIKMQPCIPGFIDGRDAIMLADKLNYDGVDTCLISSVFARRGLGYLASQGDPIFATDGIQNFDPIPVCVKELKIKKVTTTPNLVPGNNAEFVITVTNHKDNPAPNVMVTDELPVGLTLVNASNGGILSGNMVVWDLGTMQSGEVITLTYSAKSDPAIGSLSYYKDIMDDDNNWVSYSNNQVNIATFALQNTQVHTGDFAWYAPASTSKETDFVLEPFEGVLITGAQPILRFWHRYNTQPSADPGFLEFLDTEDSNPVWRRVTDEVTFRNGYPAKVAYGGVFSFANHYGFSGNSNGWVQSYFDMSAYIGKTMAFRFRFGTDDNTGPANGFWYVDEVEIMDMINYDTEACVSSGADQACDRAEVRGIIMEAAPIVGTHNPSDDILQMQVQPNPASDMVYISFGDEVQAAVQLSLISPDGRVVLQKNLTGLSNGQVLSFDVQQLPAGLYMIQFESAAIRRNAKVVIRH